MKLLLACAVCFGDPNSSQVQGQNAGIFTLLAITGGVLVGFAVLFARFIVRARRVQPVGQPHA